MTDFARRRLPVRHELGLRKLSKRNFAMSSLEASSYRNPSGENGDEGREFGLSLSLMACTRQAASLALGAIPARGFNSPRIVGSSSATVG